MKKRRTTYLFGLLALFLSISSCNNFIDDTKNSYSFQTIATLVPSTDVGGETFLADSGIKLITTNYKKPDSIPYNTRFLMAFSVWDYDMNHEDSIWKVSLNAYRIIPEAKMFEINDSTAAPSLEQQLYGFDFYSLAKDFLTISCYTFQATGKPDQLELVRDLRTDSIGSNGNYYVSLSLKHFTPSINAHNYKPQMLSYDLKPLKESYKTHTDTLLINFDYTTDKKTSVTLKYALR